MFKRKVYDELLMWKERSNGRTAVLLEGARRVGKTTIVKEFAKNEYKSYIYIDFSKTDKSIIDLFSNLLNLDMFFLKLQTLFEVELINRQSVIVFDEVQLFPKARQAIKHLVEDGRYDYIETGSLISIRKNVKNILIPSEEEKINVYPLDYEEFCWATKIDNYDILRELYNSGKQVGESVNRTLIKRFRIYMAVGGMPQAVQAFIDKLSFDNIDRVKRDIINLYLDDFKKIDPTGYTSDLFKAIPSKLIQKAKRFVISSVIEKQTIPRDYERVFEIVDSKTVNMCKCVSEPSLSLNQMVTNSFKLYIGDTGLFTTMLFMDKSNVHENIYKQLIGDKLDVNLGYLYENVVSQMITSSGRELYYHTWLKENSTHSYEIDFLITKGKKVCPIEVKSSVVRKHYSIDEFSIKYSKECGQKYLICNKDVNKDKDLFFYPIYFLPFLLEEE